MRNHAQVLLLASVVACAPVATAQAQHAQRNCVNERATSFAFGSTGGTLRPDTVYLDADGTVRWSSRASETRVAHIPRDSVRSLAHLAWSRAFLSLPTAPTRPTRNPDAARSFVDVRSACGRHKHVEAVFEESRPAFRQLLSRLEHLVGEVR